MLPFLLLAALLIPPLSAGAAVGDIGFLGPSYAGGSSPSGSKPESKLWWNDGSWWGSLFHADTKTFRIHRLDLATQSWVDTGTTLDTRSNSRADVLWDGTHLYVASHVYTTSPASGTPSRLYRLSYSGSTRRYTIDAGFPVTINDYRTETLVIDKDSTGKLWATWIQGNRVYVNRTNGNDASWGTPFVLPVSGTTVGSDDISSVVAFGPGRIGVMWSNQIDSKVYFAEHVDGASDATWQASRTAIQGPGTADDHINLKAIQAASDGRVFAAVKTSHTASSAPLIMLLTRNPSTGAWSSAVFGRVSDSHTRPIVLVDEEHDVVHMFATGPQPPSTSGQAGGTIYEKTSPLDAISFPSGYGTPVIRDASSADMNNVSSTKQNVNSSTGLVVIATNDTTDRYWYHYDPLGGGGPTPTPTPTPTATATPTPTPSSTPPGGTRSFSATADAYVNEGSPSQNNGTSSLLRVRDTSGTDYRSYLKFDVSGLGGPPASATLRLFVQDSSSNGGTARVTGTSWTESGLTWANAPALGATLGALGSVTAGQTVEVDVTGAVGGDGTVAIAIAGGVSNIAGYASRQAANGPVLVVVPSGSGPTPTPTATPTATPTQPPPGGTTTFLAAADAQVNSGGVNSNYGSLTSMRVRNGTSSAPNTYRAYVRFDVAGLSGTVTSAVLRLAATDPSDDGGSAYAVAGSWSESSLTWSNAPPLGTVLGSAGPAAVGTVDIVLPASAIPANGSVAFGIASASGDSVIYATREAATPPRLIVTTTP